ncbi:uncharacterized protein mlip [Polymixia lowei]
MESQGKNSAAPKDTATTETMSDGRIFKAEIVRIKDSEDRGAGNAVQRETYLKLKRSADHVHLPQTSPSVGVQAENTPDHFVAGPASMETAVDKHRGISQQRCHGVPLGAEVSSGVFVNRASASGDGAGPAHSAGLFRTPASSRESVLSEDWDREKSWSAMQLFNDMSPLSLSRAVSPCSSVRSGMFSPAVVRVKRHSLAPGASLLQMPLSCASSSCESLSSVGAQSPPPSRHRPPLTRLSLLTAILRKGRLPVLSAAPQRPYSPCWPVNPVTLSSCNACSAASSVASIPLEIPSRSLSLASIDSHAQSAGHREPYRCVTAPPPVHLKELYSAGPQTAPVTSSDCIHSNSGPKSERVSSKTATALSEKRSIAGNVNTPPQLPLPLLWSPTSKLKSMPAYLDNHSKTDVTVSKQFLDSSVSCSKLDSPELKSSNSPQTDHRAHNSRYITLAKFGSPSPKPVTEQKTYLPQQCNPQTHPSPSRLGSLSPQFRSLPSCPTETRPPPSRSPSVKLSSPQRHPGATSPPPPPSRHAARGPSAPEQSFPVSPAGNRLPQVPRAHCLSPSRYTPIIFPGWPSPSSSPPSTPDRLTLTPSPTPASRCVTLSPSLSLRSTPSPKPWGGISDRDDREGKKRKPHKIKLSYKSFAAIPTNTLLLDQQAIDDQVEREDPSETLDGCIGDTHFEMCSPAQLRQQSEELYAVIDEVLEDSIPKATLCSSHPSVSVERKPMDTNKTKPGVIRPMTAIPRLTVEDDEKEYHHNPFRHYLLEQSTDNKQCNLSNPSRLMQFSLPHNPELATCPACPYKHIIGGNSIRLKISRQRRQQETGPRRIIFDLPPI